MVKVTILGGGNLANHLISVFLKTEGILLQQVFNRSLHKIKKFEGQTEITDNLDSIRKSDLYVICVSDSYIETLANKISNLDGLVVHTSGAMSLDILTRHNRKGVFYPLQTFTKDKNVTFENIPFCLEANKESDLEVLKNIASKISKKVYAIDSNQRKKLHIAAVFVNNFVNHLYQVGEDICISNNIPFEILHPLIIETANKLSDLSPREAQTGPAKRNDQKTIAAHKEDLSTDLKELYSLLTEAISKTETHGNKL